MLFIPPHMMLQTAIGNANSMALFTPAKVATSLMELKAFVTEAVKSPITRHTS